jgi:Asp-tRNA(Asn)/Glu-tRNA(Gln) amidotransferase A subunit family amidase
MGFTAEGLPAGLELLGRPWSEGKLLGFAYAYEQGTRHRKAPGTVPVVRR